MKFITVFTPTYNRAYTLHALYNSLQRQADRDFEWLIVDDGSTDNTKELVSQWEQEGKVPIRYIYQENAGKMRAHNHGVRLTDSELFVCIDSDDYLTDEAIADIHEAWQKREGDVCGIIAHRAFVNKAENKMRINTFPIKGPTTLSALYNAGYVGDTTLVFRTDILKQYPFPEIEGEKFITEAISYNLIDLHHQYMLLDKAPTICEYLADGYSFNEAKTQLQNPKGWSLYYNQRARYYSPTLKKKIVNTMLYIMYARLANAHNIYDQSSTKGLLFVLSWLYYIIKGKKIINNLKKACR